MLSGLSGTRIQSTVDADSTESEKPKLGRDKNAIWKYDSYF